MKRPALFLDRDGVINYDFGYVYTPDNLKFIEGIFELVAQANLLGYLVVVITNQAGIGRGYYTEEHFDNLMNWMKSCFTARGARIDAVYYCPCHPEHGLGRYRKSSIYRKPAPGMILQAEIDLDIDLAASILIGDKTSDIEAGAAAGIGTLLHYCSSQSCHGRRIDRIADAIEYLNGAYS